LTIGDIISLVIGIGTILVSVSSLINSFIYNRLVKGQIEMQIRERISNARARYEDFILQYASDLANELVGSILRSTKEEFSNAYEEACQKYLDNKVDRDRFKKSYSNEIRSIVENNAFKQLYVPPQTQFKATFKVYEEWFDSEKKK
jgi:siroheme synthase (precorrin-2 oxidase/ferrochelatase)